MAGFADLSTNPGPSPFASLQGGSSDTVSTPPEIVQGTADAKALLDIGPDQEALLNGWEKLAQQHKDTATVFGVDSMRMQAAASSRENELRGLANLNAKSGPEFDPTGEIAQGTALLAQQTVNEDLNSRAKYALEQDTMKTIQQLALSDPIQAQIMQDNIQHGGPLDVARDYLAKRMLLSQAVTKAEGDQHKRNLLESAADTILGALPLRSNWIRAGNVNLDDHVKNWYDRLWSGQREPTEANSLWQMPTSQFSEYLPGFVDQVKNNTSFFGYESKAAELNVLKEYADSTPGVWGHSLTAGLDAVGLIPFGKIGSAIGYMAKAGARREAVNLFADAVLKSGAEAAPELTNNALPGIMATSPQVSRVGLGMSSADALARSQELIDKYIPKIQTQRFATQEEYKAAVMNTINELDAATGNYKMVDIQPARRELPGGIQVSEVAGIVGRKNGLGFARESDAIGAMSKLGMEGEAIQDSSGQWFMKVTKGVKESGFYTSNVKDAGVSNIVSRFSLGSRNLLDEFTYGLGVQAEGAQQRIGTEFGNYLKKSIGKLKQDEFKSLASVLQYSQESAVWLDRNTFDSAYSRTFGKTPREAEWNAYQAIRDAYDLDYGLRNTVEYQKRFIKGMENVNILGQGVKVDDANAFVSRDFSKARSNMRAYDVSSGTLYNKSNPLTEEVIADLKEKGYVLVETEGSHAVGPNSRVRAFLGKASDIQTGPLKPIQLGYKEGGHRFYKAKAFVKQAVEDTAEDGTKYLRAPATFTAGTKAEMKAFARDMEKARGLVKDNPNIPVGELQARMEGSTIPFDAEEFLQKVDSGEYSLDHPFEAVDDRSMPSAYLDTSRDLFDREMVGFGDTYQNMYTGSKGEILKDYKGLTAATLDPYQSINRTLSNITRNVSFTDYKLSTIERWANNFKPYLDVAGEHSGMSPEFVFSNSSFKRDTPDALKQAGEGQRDAIRRTLGWKGERELALESMSNRMAEKLAGDTPGLRDHFVDAARNWLSTNNPVQFLRGMSFDMYLGFFNPNQIFTQISTAVAANAMRPQSFPKVVASMLPTAAAMQAKAADWMLDDLAKKGLSKLAGFGSDEEFKLYMKTMYNSGLLDLGHGHTLIGEYGSHVSTTAWGKVQQVREAGRFFFNNAEKVNLMTAYRIAWDELAQGQSISVLKSNDFARRVYARATDYGFGMQRGAQAVWQRGLLGVPTQFFAYNARMLEAMFSKTFTPSQRLNLFLSQAFLYGSAGVPLGSVVADYLKSKTGQAPQVGTPWSVADRGMLDNIIHMVSGVDVLAGKRLASGDFVADTIESIMGHSQYGEVSTADMLGGASFNLWAGVSKDLVDWVKYTIAESGQPGAEAMSREAALNVFKHISVVNNASKAYHIYKYGNIVSKTGGILLDDLPKADAVAIMLGFQPGEQNQLNAVMNYNKHNQEEVDDAAKQLNGYRSRYLNEPDNRDQIRQEINLYSQILKPSVRQAALKKINKDGKSLFKSAGERAQQITQVNEGVNNDGQSN